VVVLPIPGRRATARGDGSADACGSKGGTRRCTWPGRHS